MAMICEMYQDTGPVVAGHGTTRISVDNIGWKSSGLDETHSFVYYPIRRPTVSGYTYSFTQYNYVKISGTYAAGRAPRFVIQGNITGPDAVNRIKLYYKLTSVYAEPSNIQESGMTEAVFIPYADGVQIKNIQLVLPARLSTSGPESANSYVHPLVQDTTYYTEYLVTQLQVDTPSAYYQYGNLGDLRINFHVDEYETGDT